MNDPVAAIRRVALALGPLAERVVFVGGAAAPLVISDFRSGTVRPTEDVDLIVDADTRIQYAEVEQTLRDLGLRNDTSEDAPICRYLLGDIPVDVMPIHEDVLGFSNRWYRYALESAETHHFDGVDVRIISAVAFVATKLEAFASPHRRGSGDMLASHDMEDLLTVIDGRPEFEAEVAHAPSSVRTYLEEAFSALVEDADFVGAIEGHLQPGPSRPDQARAVLATLRRIATG